MKPKPLTKLDKKNTMMMPWWQNMTSLLFVQFMANLEQSGNQTPEAWSVKLIFSLRVTFYPTKIENRSKKYLAKKIFSKKMLFFSRQ